MSKNKITKKSHFIFCDFETTKHSIDNPSQVYSFSVTLNKKYWFNETRSQTKYEYFDVKAINELIKQQLLAIDNKPDKEFFSFYGVDIKIFLKFLDCLKVEKAKEKRWYMVFQNGSGFDLRYLNQELSQNKDYNFFLRFPNFNQKVKQEIKAIKYKDNEDFIDYLENDILDVDNENDEKHKPFIYMLRNYDPIKLKWRIEKCLFQKLSIHDFTYTLKEKKFYTYEIKNKNKVSIVAIDNYLQAPSSLDIKGKAVDYPKLEKADGYVSTKLYNKVSELPKNEIEYLVRDTEILYLFTLKFYNKLWDNGVKIKLTAPSIAYHNWVGKLLQSEEKRLLEEGIIRPSKLKKSVYEIKVKGRKFTLSNGQLYKTILNDWFPTDWLVEDDYLHYSNIKDKYYVGGCVFVNNKYQELPPINMNLNSDKMIVSYDVNSSYPSFMNSDKLAPYGEPIKSKISNKIYTNGKYYQLFRITPLKTLKTDYFPIFHNGNIDNRTWIQDLEANKHYFLDTNSYNYFLEAYFDGDERKMYQNCDIKVQYTFKAKPAKFFFRPFIDLWFNEKVKAKKSGDIFMSMISKLFLNSCYGKFGSKLLIDNAKIFKLWDDGSKEDYIKFRDVLKAYYFPMACAITYGARLILAEGVRGRTNQVSYCDTDSVKIVIPKMEENKIDQYVGDDFYFEIDNKKLGAWKKEFVGNKWIFRTAKQYLILNTNTQSFQQGFAGVHFEKELIGLLETENIGMYDYFERFFEKFIYGFTTSNQMTSKKVRFGGIDFQTSEKIVKPIWELPKKEESCFNSKEDFIKLIHLEKQP